MLRSVIGGPVLLTAVFLACAPLTSAPIPTPSPAPNIEATISARVKEQVASQLARLQPTATPIPTFRPTATPVPIPTTTPTPRPTSTATPTPYSIREYPERQADGSVALVQQWSNGRFTKRVVQAAGTPTPTRRPAPPPAPPPTPVPSPTVQAAPSISGLYRVNLTRKDKDLYKEAGGVLFVTRYCYEYVYGEDAIYDADRYVIRFENNSCDVARVITKYFESYINGTFNGWEGSTVFPLGNGQVWQQASYSYLYHYAYNPQVIIYEASGNNWMRVQDVDEALMVVRLR